MLNEKSTERMLLLCVVICVKLRIIHADNRLFADDDILALMLCDEFILIRLKKFEIFFKVFIHAC